MIYSNIRVNYSNLLSIRFKKNHPDDSRRRGDFGNDAKQVGLRLPMWRAELLLGNNPVCSSYSFLNNLLPEYLKPKPIYECNVSSAFFYSTIERHVLLNCLPSNYLKCEM